MSGDSPDNLCEHYSITEEETNEMGDGKNTDQTEHNIRNIVNISYFTNCL